MVEGRGSRRPRTGTGFRAAAVLGALVLLCAVFAPRLLVPVQAQDGGSFDDWSAPRTGYISETGYTIAGVFLDYWRPWGGASAFGTPITAESQEHGHTAQYYTCGG